MISQELLQGFISEASDLLDDIEPSLVSYPKIEEEVEREEVANRVFRHFHSIKGSAGFVGLHDIAKLTHEAENLLEQYRNAPGKIIPQETITVLCRTVDFLRLMFEEQARGNSDKDETDSPKLIALIKKIMEATREARVNPIVAKKRHDTTIQIGKSDKQDNSRTADVEKPRQAKSGSTQLRRQPNPGRTAAAGGAAEKDQPEGAKQLSASTSDRQQGKSKTRAKGEGETQRMTKAEKSDTVRIIRAASQGTIEKLTKNEFLGRYVAEANELLEQTEQALLQAEQHPEYSSETIQEALRCLHSFKGNSGFMNLKDLERLSHRMETEIENTIGKAVGLDSHSFDVLLQMIDVLRQGVLDLSYGGSGDIPEADLYIGMMDEVKSGITSATRFTRKTVVTAARKRPDADEAEVEKSKQTTSALARIDLTKDETATETDLASTRLLPLGRPSQQEDLSQRRRSAKINIKDEQFESVARLAEAEKQNRQDQAEEAAVRAEPIEEQDLERALSSAPIPDLAEKSEAKSKPAADDTVSLHAGEFTASPKERPHTKRIAVTPRNDIRVDLNKLDLMLDLVGELVIAETMVTRHPAVVDQDNESLERAVHQLRRVANALQDMAMSVRMIPLASTFRRMIRLAYDLSMKAGKQVDLVLLGEETEADRTVIERISDPLVHIIRNAIDHGIEPPEERRELGKPESGRVTIEGRHEGGEVWIVITDDGRGLDRQEILAKARERGMITTDGSELSDNHVYNFIFEPGFSTAHQATDISGRGFSMDVVKKNVEKLSGKIDIRTREGEGTAVIMRIPLTLAIIEGMLVRAGDTRYIIPLLSIRESMKPDPEQIMYTPDGQALIRLRDELIPIVKLDEVFSRAKASRRLEDGILTVVEGEDGSTVALFADELLGQQETVIKGLTGWLKKSRGVSGCTILGDGEVGLILDIGAIVRLAGREG